MASISQMKGVKMLLTFQPEVAKPGSPTKFYFRSRGGNSSICHRQYRRH